MQHTITIEIVSDISCPWCIIGYQSLSQALKALAPQLTANIIWKPFELNPDMPAQGQLLHEHLHQKYGSSKADIEQTTRMITARGAALGFTFNFNDGSRIYNTFNAHRLLYWSTRYNKQTELKLALFHLYFSVGGNPSNHEALLDTVVKVGLPRYEASQILSTDLFVEEVRTEQAKYLSMGINMVPTFIFDQQYKITGGLPVEDFVTQINSFLSASHKKT